MEKKHIDWENLGFDYTQTDYRFVSNYKDGAWDDGCLSTEATVVTVSYTHLDVYKRQIGLSMKALMEEEEKEEEIKVEIPKSEEIGTSLGDLFKNLKL